MPKIMILLFPSHVNAAVAALTMCCDDLRSGDLPGGN